MMTSSGSGAYRVGGSLNSSNLSPLAPPFKVDKSFTKPNSTNPSVNFVEGPAYGSCFEPTPGQFWNSSTSSGSGQKCVATEPVINDMKCSSPPSMYGYRNSQSSTSPAGMYYGSGSGSGDAAFDPFAYDPFPNSLPSNTNGEAKSFFGPYVPPRPQNDGYLSLGVGSESGYDLLSYSRSAHLSGCIPAQVDHGQNMPSDVGYKSKWGSIWSGLNESEHGKWTDYVQGFTSKDLSTPHLSSNKSPVFVDGSNKSQPFVDINVHPFGDGSSSKRQFDDMSNESHLKQGAALTTDLGLRGQASTAKDNCFNIFGGAYSLGCLGIEQQGCKPLSEFSNKITSACASVSKETTHQQAPVLESISSFCGSQKANGSSPEGHFKEPSFFMFGCASTTANFPKSITELPYRGTISSVESTPSAVQRNSMGIDAPDQSSITQGYNFTYHTEAQMPLGPKRHSTIRIRKPVSSSTAASSCKIGEIENNRFDDKVSSEQMKSSSQLPHQLSFHDLNVEDSDVEAVYSVEKNSAGSDSHNPAEDSPCWKGASSQHLSPFGYSESVDADILVKKIDRCRSLSSQDFQNNSIYLPAFGSKNFSSGKVNETTSLEKPAVYDCAFNSNENCCSAEPKSRHFDLNTRDGFLLAEDWRESMVECHMINKSKADLSEALHSEEHGNGISVAEHSLSSLPLNIDNDVSNLVPRHKASLTSAGEDSNSKIDVNVLLRTMMSLSETLRCYCFSNQAEVSEKHSLAVKQILSNLNASMLLMSGQSIPTTVLSSLDQHALKESPLVQMVNDADMLAASLKLGGTAGEFFNISCKDDNNSFENANMTEAVKKLISEDSHEEDMDQQKLLYKKLWLEAEASLSVMTAKARFLRMKTEMSRTHDGTQDKDSPTSSDVPMGLHEDAELANENMHSLSLGECPKPTTTSQHNHQKVLGEPKSQVDHLVFLESEASTETENKTSFSSLCASRPGVSVNNDDSCSTSHANEVETCVMARYQILKNRVRCPDALNRESNQTSGEHNRPSSEFHVGNIFPASGTNSKVNDLETSVFGGYQILKGRGDNSGYLNCESQQLPGDENYLPDDCSSRDNALLDSQMSNSLGVADEREASVMARFRVIQNRTNHSNSLINNLAPGQVSAVEVNDGTEDMGGGHKKGNIKENSFGPYPQLTEDEMLKSFDIGVNEEAFDPIVKTDRISSVILEGWYDNDCSTSDWEHISSRDV